MASSPRDSCAVGRLLNLAFVIVAVIGRLISAEAISDGIGTRLTQAHSKKRGKILNGSFNEQDLLAAYDEIKNEYREKAFGRCDENGHPVHDGKSNNWRLLTTMNPGKNENNADDEVIKVFIMEHPSDPTCPYVKMETILPIPVEQCWNFLSLDKWDETMPKMDPFYEGLDIFGDYTIASEKRISEKSENVIRMILARKRTKRILTFGKREFVFVSVEDTPLDDGTWVSGTVSVEIDEKVESSSSSSFMASLRRNKSYTRAFQDSIAFYKPVQSFSSEKAECIHSGRTKLTIMCRIDLNDSNGNGGCIPMWLYVKTIGMTGARSVLNMRQCLLEAKKNHSK